MMDSSLFSLMLLDFENWAVIALGGVPNKVQVGDMDVDGRIFPVRENGRVDAPKAGGLFSEDWFPIQVKQTDKVGRPVIDSFESVMEREGEGGRQRGFIVSFDFTKDAEQECAAFYKRTKRVIKLLTVQKILDEGHVQKMWPDSGATVSYSRPCLRDVEKHGLEYKTVASDATPAGLRHSVIRPSDVISPSCPSPCS